MIAKVIATAESRDLATNRLFAALRSFHIRGIRTNVAFLMRVLDSDAFRHSAIDTGYLDREGAAFVESIDDDADRTREARSATASAERAPDARGRGPAFDPWNGVAAQAANRGPSPPRRKRAGSDGRQVLTAPMPATVISIPVKTGDAVHKGDVVVLLEAMKMELPLRAMADGVVAAVRCREGELVQADAALVELQ
jgi:acetyl/propionyl-CoA carboxylase alpha subunit